MSRSTNIANPFGAYRNVTDFTTFRDTDSRELEFGVGEEYVLRANVAITKGQALMFVVPTATLPLSVTPFTAAADEQIFAGAALHAAAAGEAVGVLRHGFGLVRVDLGVAAAFGSVLQQPITATGDFEVIADPVGGAGPLAPVLGLVLSGPLSTNFAYAYVGWTPANDFTV